MNFRSENKLSRMLLFATIKHEGQFDKGGLPYILHPVNVMLLVGKRSNDEELKCIALGHDLLEDTDATIQELYEIGMTERIVRGIKALTKMPGQSKKEYYDGIIANGSDAMIVKMADLTHNSDLNRIKSIEQRDLDRSAYYRVMYKRLSERLEEMESNLAQRI